MRSVASVGGGNGSGTGIARENDNVVLDLGNLDLGISVGDGIGHRGALGQTTQRGSGKLLTGVQFNILLVKCQSDILLSLHGKGVGGGSLVVLVVTLKGSGDDSLTCGNGGHFASVRINGSHLCIAAAVGNSQTLGQTLQCGLSNILTHKSVRCSRLKCQLQILLDNSSGNQVELRSVDVIIF